MQFANRATIEYNLLKRKNYRGDEVEFLNVREFRSSPKSVWEKLSQKGELVITNNGKPTALMLNIANGEIEELLRAIRQARAMIAINNMRLIAEENGYMSDEEIEAEIQAYRKEKSMEHAYL